MVALLTTGRVVLLVVNALFLMLCLALVFTGFSLLVFSRRIYGLVLDTSMELLQDVLTKTNLGTYVVKEIDIGEVLSGLAVGLIVGGLVLAAISFLGCFGGYCNASIILRVYALMVAVCVVLEIVALGILYDRTDLLTDYLKKSMSDYKGLGSSDVYSVTWNIMMIQFQCCGVDSYEDFSEFATNWNKQPGGGGPLVTPIACCKTLPSSASYGCASSFDTTKNNGETGCFQTIWNLSVANLAIVIPVLLNCGIIQIVFVVIALKLAKK